MRIGRKNADRLKAELRTGYLMVLGDRRCGGRVAGSANWMRVLRIQCGSVAAGWSLHKRESWMAGGSGESETHRTSHFTLVYSNSEFRILHSFTQIPNSATLEYSNSAFCTLCSNSHSLYSALTSLFPGFISAFLKLVYDPENDRPGKTHAGQVSAMAEFIERR